MQQVADDAPPAYRYFSDGFATYARLLYPGTHAVALDESRAYSVERDNAGLRHYPTKASFGTVGSPEPLLFAVHLAASASIGSFRRCRLTFAISSPI